MDSSLLTLTHDTADLTLPTFNRPWTLPAVLERTAASLIRIGSQINHFLSINQPFEGGKLEKQVRGQYPGPAEQFGVETATRRRRGGLRKFLDGNPGC
ncbi:hypothetical protein J6590_000298 [Homalodisca vitripennis]|nr:hypothetical protein J6590_000298 [Homalodisca vitripennis]